MIDLHTHTNCSDGDFTPEELIRLAAEKGMKVIAITDHDSIQAYDDDIVSIAKKLEVLLITGVELSTVDENSGEKIHVVGLDIDVNNEELRSVCEQMNLHRRQALVAAEQKLCDLGLSLRINELLESQNIITKNHVAADIITNPANAEKLFSIYNEIPSKGRFISDYLSRGKPASSGRQNKLFTHQAVDVIKRSCGKAICAHPSQNVMLGFGFEDMKKLILRNGFDGIETVNIQYDNTNKKRFDMVIEFTEFANSEGLLISGGSDFHGQNKTNSDLGLSDEPYRITMQHLESILS